MVVDNPEQPVLAADTQRRGPLKVVFSFPVALAALLIVLTVLTARERFDDPDLWWHLKTGQIIWETHSIPRVDVFSFTTNRHSYTPHEWLAQLTIYGAYRFGGYTGLMLWLCVIASLIFIGGYVLCWLYSGNGKVAFVGAFGMWFFATVGLAIRPQLLGYLLLVCELLILCCGRTRSRHYFWALPPLFTLWVNCHGSFFLGLIVAGAVLFCSFLEFRVGQLVAERWSRPKSLTLALALVFSIAGLFINPVGVAQLAYPIDALFNQHIGLKYSSEWQQLPFSDPRMWILIAAAGLVLLIPLLRRLDLRFVELVLLGMGFALALQHGRMLFVFGLLVMPTLCRLLTTTWEQYESARDRMLPNALVIALAGVVSVLAFPSQATMAEQVQKVNPVKALEFLNRSHISGRMFNEYTYGGYLIWAAPDRKVFVDGRADVFEWSGVLEDLAKCMTLQDDPRLLLKKYRIDYCLLARGNPLATVLKLLPGWKTAYTDDMFIVFTRTGV